LPPVIPLSREQIRLDFERDRWKFEKAQVQRSLVFSAKQKAFARFVSDYRDANDLWKFVHKNGGAAADLIKSIQPLEIACDGVAVFDAEIGDMCSALSHGLQSIGADNTNDLKVKIEQADPDVCAVADGPGQSG
jgi:hypothetical protein